MFTEKIKCLADTTNLFDLVRHFAKDKTVVKTEQLNYLVDGIYWEFTDVKTGARYNATIKLSKTK